MRISRRHLLLGSAALAWAQDPQFSSDVNVVTLLATVRDKEGRVAKDLRREDFVLLEDGKAQTIRYFSRETDLPLTVGLLVDTSRSQIGVMKAETRASYTFLDRVLDEKKDVAFVASFDTDVRLLQGFTSSRTDLAAALDELSVPGKLATVLYEAVRATSEQQMRRRTGRKAFVLLSDGVSFRDPASIGTAIEYAQRADTIVYSILFAEVGFRRRPGRKRGRDVMGRLARETGGAFFEVSSQQPIEKTYAEIEETLRNQYSIGYTPSKGAKDGYRRIKLSVKRPNLIVQTRDGYYGER